MTKEYLKNSWRKLDNTAKIFSLAEEDDKNFFRYSVVLKQDIDDELLKIALDITLGCFYSFKVKIGSGLFWNYLEFNKKEPIIRIEDDIPCKPIDFKNNNDYLFRVTYYKKKINLDVFHVLTDGAGAINFFKSIIYNYLDLRKGLLTYSDENNVIYASDQYLKNYDKKIKSKISMKSAFQISNKRNKNINNTYHYIVDVNEVKAVSKKYDITITEYLTAIYIYAMYLSFFDKRKRKDIVIAVPVDLRKYYNVDTISNFFTCMYIKSNILEKKYIDFNVVLNEVHNEFVNKLNELEICKSLSREVRLGNNIFVRFAPLFLKKKFIKCVGNFVNTSQTSTLSNVGNFNIDNKYKKYINNIYALVIPGKFQKIKCTVCSFDNKLNITINSNIDDRIFQYTFYKLLKNNIKRIKLESNHAYLK